MITNKLLNWFKQGIYVRIDTPLEYINVYSYLNQINLDIKSSDIKSCVKSLFKNESIYLYIVYVKYKPNDSSKGFTFKIELKSEITSKELEENVVLNVDDFIQNFRLLSDTVMRKYMILILPEHVVCVFNKLNLLDKLVDLLLIRYEFLKIPICTEFVTYNAIYNLCSNAASDDVFTEEDMQNIGNNLFGKNYYIQEDGHEYLLNLIN